MKKITIQFIACIMVIGCLSTGNQAYSATTGSQTQPNTSSIHVLEKIKDVFSDSKKSDGEDAKQTSTLSEQEAKEYYQQPPLDSRYYYELKGRAPIAPASETTSVRSLLFEPIQPSIPSCSAFDQDKALEQAIEKEVTRIFAASMRVANKLKDTELYQLQASDPRLFNLVALATEIAKGIVDNNLARCQALKPSTGASTGQETLQTSLNALLVDQKIRSIRGSLDSQTKPEDGKVADTLNEVMAKVEAMDQAPDLLAFDCPCALTCGKTTGKVELIASALACAFDEKTKQLGADNQYVALFGSGQQAGKTIANLVGETTLKTNQSETAQSYSILQTVGQGLEGAYTQYAKDNMTKLKLAVEKIKQLNGKPIPPSIVDELSLDSVGHIITQDIVLYLALEPTYKVKGQIAHIAYNRAFVQTFHLARLAKQLLDSALRLPKLNPVSRHYLQIAKQQIMEDVKLLDYEAKSARHAAESLNIVIQNEKAQVLKGSIIEGYAPSNDICWSDGAPTACANIKK